MVYEKSWDLGTPISEKRWGDNGKLLSQLQWSKGALESKKVWSSSGQLISEISWGNGHPTKHNEWAQNGAPTLEKIWVNGELKSYKAWGDNKAFYPELHGKLVTEATFDGDKIIAATVISSSGKDAYTMSKPATETIVRDILRDDKLGRPNPTDHQKNPSYTSACGLSPFGNNSRPEGFDYIKSTRARLYSDY